MVKDYSYIVRYLGLNIYLALDKVCNGSGPLHHILPGICIVIAEECVEFHEHPGKCLHVLAFHGSPGILLSHRPAASTLLFLGILPPVT